MSDCSVEGCDVRSVARAMCRMHYRRWKRHGDPLAAVQDRPHKISMEDRFWGRVEKAGKYDCWPWTGATKRGYGFFNHLNGQQAHRYSYELHHGPIPDGMTVDHLCWNTRCQNPKHLQLLTVSGNASRQKSTFDTHCPAGHLYDADNEVPASNLMSSGNRSRTRRCRACTNERKRINGRRQRRERGLREHPGRSRTHCPQGHELREPNITESARKVGQRKCLACSRARAACHGRPHLDFQATADEKYRAIVTPYPALLARVGDDINREVRA